jgi:hypothetical protein
VPPRSIPSTLSYFAFYFWSLLHPLVLLAYFVLNIVKFAVMSQECGPWATKSRQYRPSYSYLPASTSRPNFGAPCISKAAQPAPGFNQRRTMSTFPGADPLHSAPTVASFALTASVLSHDISHPSPKIHRLSLQPRIRTPTRIPTPTASIQSSTKCRAVRSPAASSSKEVWPLSSSPSCLR